MKFDRHHKFARHKNRIKKYGSLMDHPSNIQEIEHNEHLSGRVERQSEREFCINAGIAKCEYCINFFSDCLYKLDSQATFCRMFSFDLDMYEKFNNL